VKEATDLVGVAAVRRVNIVDHQVERRNGAGRRRRGRAMRGRLD
jgi:hypothetical protein